VIVDPPSEVGGDHETAIAVLTAVVAKDVGGPGFFALGASARAMPPGISIAPTVTTAARAMPFETLIWAPLVRAWKNSMTGEPVHLPYAKSLKMSV
jgi:hypothetical protein